MEQRRLDQAEKQPKEKNSHYDSNQANSIQKRRKATLWKRLQPRRTEKTGLSFKEALKLGIPVDFRRRTIHEENINAINGLLKSKKTTSKSKKRRKSKS